MDEVSLKALAKINISLDVLGQREDGYHDVRMVMQSIRLYDRVELKKTKNPEVKLEPNLFMIPMGDENIAYRAAKLMKEKFELKEGVNITIQKYIPMSAGLAGGSTDAAAVIVGMNRLFGLGLDQAKMCEIGLELGADVPFCIMRGTALAEGIGEKLTPLTAMPRCYVLIAKPAGVDISTKTIYEKLGTPQTHPDTDGIIERIKEKDLHGVSEMMGNVLEKVTIPMVPQISEIKRIMKENGALGAMMTGSGPSVFGLYEEEKGVQASYEALKASGMQLELYSTETYQLKDEQYRNQKRRYRNHRGNRNRNGKGKGKGNGGNVKGEKK